MTQQTSADHLEHSAMRDLIDDLPRQAAIRALAIEPDDLDTALLPPDGWWRAPDDRAVPLASTISPDEIGEALRVGIDPWAIDASNSEDVCPTVDGRDRRSALAAWQVGFAIRDALASGTHLDAADIFRSGAVIELRLDAAVDIRDAPLDMHRLAEAAVETIRGLLAPDRAAGIRIIKVKDRRPSTPPHRASRKISATHKEWLDRLEGNATKKDPDAEAAREILVQIAAGATVLCFSEPGAHLPSEVEALLDLRATLRHPSVDDLIGVLALTHSETGQVADEALRERLPSDQDLRLLSFETLLAGMAGTTTLQVATRLSQLVACVKANPERVPELRDDANRDPQSETSSSLVPPKKLGDLKGQPRVVEELLGLAADITAWKRGEVAWTDVITSVIVFGPPGTGKTMAAEALAGELDVPLIDGSIGRAHSSGPLSDTLKAFENAVSDAEKATPCVFLMDELDSLMPRDKSRDSGYIRLLVNAILEALNRIQSKEGVILVGATNDLAMIDPAIRRSGRFDLKLAMAPPNLEGLKAIVRAAIDVEVDDEPKTAVFDETLNALAGASGADAAMVARRAKVLARRRAMGSGTEAQVEPADLSAAIREIVPPTDVDDLRRVAIHEVGHAIVGVVRGLGLPRALRLQGLDGVTIFSRAGIRTSTTLADRIVAGLAGREAERLVFGDMSMGSGTGVDSDLAVVTSLILQAEFQCGLGQQGAAWEPDPGGSLALAPNRRNLVNVQLEAHGREAAAILLEHRETLLEIADRLVVDREFDATAIEMFFAPFAKNHLPERDGALYLRHESRGDHDDTDCEQDPSNRRLTPVDRVRQAHPSSSRTLP